MPFKCFIVTVFLSFWAVSLQAQPAASPSHPPASDIAIQWAVLTNQAGEAGRSRSKLTITNTGSVPLPARGWALYFNFLRRIDPASLPPSVALTHINGDFFKLEPATHFAPIRPGEQRAILYEAFGPTIKQIDAPAGFYFVFEDARGQPKPPAAVTDVTVAPFSRPQQTNRNPSDALPVPTAVARYRQNQALTTLPREEVGAIVPTPTQLDAESGAFTLDRTARIQYEAGLAAEADVLAHALAPALGTRLSIAPVSDAPAAIVLRRGAIAIRGDSATSEEAYRLTVRPDRGIEIVGSSSPGVFYGIQSLRALVPIDAYERSSTTIDLEAVTVTDAPRFGYRGLHLDVSRNFQTAEDVKRLLDVMAQYKLNTFHFHLTDDEGWRLAIRGLPELTEVGARRGHTTTERDHLVPSYGSGPDPDPDVSYGSGWYTREQYIDILRYARERHIEVIPEIDVPGHARAAIKAMEARYRTLTNRGQEDAASEHRLIHPEDTSEYASVQNWDDNVIDVCQASTYRFLGKVFDEIEAMHEAANAPLTTIHVGGDEVPHGAWEGSPACQSLLQRTDSLHHAEDLFPYFLHRANQMLAERGLVTGGWEEVALKETEQHGTSTDVANPAFVGQNVRPYVWANIWGSGSEDNAYQLANVGYEVVMSHASNLYFDMAYNKHPQEDGFYWAAFVDDAGPFRFMPMNLYNSAETDAMGHPLADDDFEGYARLTEDGRRNIIGIQGQLWGETLRSADRLEYMAVPRLMSLAERAWAAQPDWATVEDDGVRGRQRFAAWNAFANRLGQRALPRLSHLDPDWAYRLPVPGAVIEGGLLKANVALPGLTIRYTTDGSTPTGQSPAYRGPVAVEAGATVTLRTFDGQGRGSRATTVHSH